MNIVIRDIQTLKSLGPLDLAIYLKSKGWNETRIQPGQSSTWIFRDSDNEEYEILLPLNSTIKDYALRIGELLKTLELAENRSQFEIYHDLQSTSTDVVRLRFNVPNSTEGSIPIEKGVEIMNSVWDMMMSAACSTIAPRPIYPCRKPNLAVDYMRKVRLGQTEQGSYVVTVLSPVPPELNIGQTKLFKMEDPADPFERKVTVNLANALNDMRSAAERTAVTSSFEHFEKAIERGVSANLCEAVAKLSFYNDQYQDLNVNFSWARTRPILREPSQNIHLSAELMPVFKEVARVFKESAPQEDFEVRGPIVRLERQEGASMGKVTVLAFIDEQPRKINFELPDELYHMAVQAHDHQQTIICYGILIREGRSFTLKNPRELTLESE